MQMEVCDNFSFKNLILSSNLLSKRETWEYRVQSTEDANVKGKQRKTCPANAQYLFVYIKNPRSYLILVLYELHTTGF